MSESNKQTVVDSTDEKAAKPATEVKDGAQGEDDLDTLLSQFDKKDGEGADAGSKPQPKAPVPAAKPAQKDDASSSELHTMVQSLVQREEERRQAEVKRQYEADMTETVKSVRGSVSGISDRLVRAWIEGMAEENPKLTNAWIARKDNPQAFNRVVEKLSRDFKKEFEKRPDANVTEDREAVAAAVRGASTETPKAKDPEYKSMSDAQFAEDTYKKFGFRPQI